MVKKSEIMIVAEPSIGMRSKPSIALPLETECLFGEQVETLDHYLEWTFCKLFSDNYQGWVKSESLCNFKTITHRVLSKRTFVLERKSEKSNSIIYLPLGSKLSVKQMENNWAEIFLPSKYPYKTGFVPIKHISNINNITKDWVFISESLLETPYKWGGRDTLGIDCSALLQISYETFGQKIPRNTTDQVNIDKEIINDVKKLDRGSVVFWEGHVGIMVDKLNCIHANAYHMKTIIEPLKEIIFRMGEKNPIIKMMDFNK